MNYALVLNNAIIKYYPEEVLPRINLGLCLIDIGQYDDAGNELKIALLHEPNNLDVISNLIGFKHSLKDYSYLNV